MRPLHDWVLVELESERNRVTDSGLQLIGEDPVRYAKVVAAGPGRRYGEDQKIVPTQVKVGDRVCFFIAALQTQQGKAIVHQLSENQGLIKESDILGVLDGEIKVTR